MLKSAELGRVLSKQEYEATVAELRTSLLKVQAELEHAKFPVVVLLHGADGAGKSQTLNTLNEWFDARFLRTEAYERPNERERERPEFWRYWMWQPRAGQIALFLGSWYTRPILDRVLNGGKERHLAASLSRINAFERTLADNGTLFISCGFTSVRKSRSNGWKPRLERRARASWLPSATGVTTVTTTNSWR